MAGSWVWQWLRRPWLAIFAGAIGLVLVLAVWQLPQLPGQLVDEHAAAANWLLATSTAYGIWGNAFLALGLFDVPRSPLLYLLLALLLPTLAAQLADQLGALRQHRSVQAIRLETPAQTPGEALQVSSARPLFRYRGIVASDAGHIADLIEHRLREDYPYDFPYKERVNAPLAPLQPADDSAYPLAEEFRIRSLRRPRLQYLRPLLMIGLLTSVAGAWVALAFGWQVTAPPLAPGGTFRSANRDLVLHYAVPTSTTQQVTLVASLQNAAAVLPATEAARRTLGSAALQLRPVYPAILIGTADGNERLSLPGETTLSSQIGLVFANPGSEESILIPDQGAGLRVVQRAGSHGFVLELYRSDAIEPIYRAELTPGGRLTVPFGPADPGLVIMALPGLQVDVRHLPGLSLVPIGVILALIGALAFQRRSAFVLAQVAPWSPEQSVVVLQSDHGDTVDALRDALAAISPATTPESEKMGDEPLTQAT